MNRDLCFNEIKINKIVVFIFLLITGLPTLNGSMINNFLFGLILIAILAMLTFNKGINIWNNYYLLWVLLVISFLFISIIWAANEEWAIGRFKRVLLITIFCVYVSFLVKNKRDFNTILKIFVLTRVLVALYILVILDFSTLGEMRIGAGSLGDEWNANTIGMNLALATFSLFFILKTENTIRKHTKIYYYVCMLLFSFIIVFTGSRKSLFILIFSIGFFSFLIREKGKVARFSLVAMMLALVIYLSLNIPIFYNIIGSRIEGLLSSVTGQGVVDKSTDTRLLMIDTGFKFFLEKPLFGHGIDSFRQLYYNITGDFRYSHNNYIELLVSIGVVGTFIYYLGLIMVMLKSYKRDNVYAVFSLALIVTFLIIDYGLVSYTSTYIQFFICLTFISLFIIQKNENVKESMS